MHTRKITATTTALVLTTILGGVVAACGSDDAGDSADAVCPTNLVIQTDWWPEVEHGGSYHLIDDDGVADPNLFSYRGSIRPEYAVGGIETVEIRAGGDAIEFQPVVVVMKTDPDITLGYVNSDEVIQQSATVATTAVVGTLEINPQVVMWDPEQLAIDPDDPATIVESDARLLHSPDSTYVDWLISQGYLDESQSDPNYSGAPDQWVGSGGDFLQQAFATNEVYQYENLIDWKDGAPAPVDYALLDDLGWRPYPATQVVLTERLGELSPCLEVLVPVLQQAWVDYFDAPQDTAEAIIGITETYNNYWSVTPELNEAAFALMEVEGISSNGPDDTYGNFDPDRMQAVFDDFAEILEIRNVDLPEGYTVEDSYTNDFIDPSVGR